MFKNVVEACSYDNQENFSSAIFVSLYGWTRSSDKFKQHSLLTNQVCQLFKDKYLLMISTLNCDWWSLRPNSQSI